MFRYNLIVFIFFVFCSAFGFAQDFKFDSKKLEEKFNLPKNIAPLNTKSWELGYVSWSELVDLETASQTDNTKVANFFGTLIGFEKMDIDGHFGRTIEAAGIFGQAHIGENSGTISYQKNFVKWYGAMASARFAYRFHKAVTTSIGPQVLHRQISWPDVPSGTDVKSGADLNLGVIFDLRLQLGEHIDVKQTLGTLAFKAATYWSLGINYRY